MAATSVTERAPVVAAGAASPAPPAIRPGPAPEAARLANRWTHPDDALGGVLARAVDRRATLNRSVLQRFREISPGDVSYPQKWHAGQGPFLDEKAEDDERFFSYQEARGGRFFDASGQPYLVNVADAKLHISNNRKIAVVATGEAKTFFAARSIIDKANGALAGGVRLAMTRRHLWNGDDSPPLFEVEPMAAAQNARGIAMRTPQRCNEMAGFASGNQTLKIPNMDRAEKLLVEAVQSATNRQGETWPQEHARRIKNFRDERGYDEFQERLLACALHPRIRGRVEKALESEGMNGSLDPRPGEVITTMGTLSKSLSAEAANRRVEPFPYHFGTVVARSDRDYVTLENYARRDPVVTNTSGSGDPLFFFRMYSANSYRQTWHYVQTATGAFVGLPISFKYR